MSAQIDQSTGAELDAMMSSRERTMTKYESNRAVDPVRITTYRHLRKAARRGWAVEEQTAPPTLADLSWPRATGGTSRS
ncbi:hypothetical protein NS184_16490 [Curtobacterium luteum]|uniref:Uncharacterized protein n=2 Tax=Curtobacterium luteum TaxID=33881 RepID=A0A175RH22_9MICO|nr:hypothetical protein NS184_16490 [Curtobacterium luteum]